MGSSEHNLRQVDSISNLDRAYIHPYSVTKDISPKDLYKTKVTFINMPIREQALPNNAPLGPGLLAARLEAYGVEVNIIDLNVYRIKDHISIKRGLVNGRVLNLSEVTQFLESFFSIKGEQDLVALSGLITTLKWQSDVTHIVRKIQPSVMIASGGGLATEFRQTLFEWIPELDAVAHSEGDDVILKMALDARHVRRHNLKKGLLSSNLKPYFVGVVGGRPRFLYDGGRPRCLDDLPFPAWNLLEADINGYPVLDTYLNNPIWGSDAKNSSAAPFHMNRSMNTVSSRGCPFACKFCFRGAQGERNYGIRSAQNLTKEIQMLAEKYSVDFIGITDDNFMVNPKRIAELVPEMRDISASYQIKWGTHGRLDEAADIRPITARGKKSLARGRLRVEDMAESGCAYIGFGAESASAKVLKEMGKGGFMLSNGSVRVNDYSFPLTMIRGIENTHQANIHANCTWIMGYPGETLDDLKTTVAFIHWQQELYVKGKTTSSEEYNLALNSVNKSLFVATAYPGTEMFKHPNVKEKLGERFNIQFDGKGDPVADNNFYNYVLSLNDATDVLYSEDEAPLNFSELSDDMFLRVRECVDNRDLTTILNL
jgi:radical SAM superfamily enzyme YgiQ (UPF0313 family)